MRATMHAHIFNLTAMMRQEVAKAVVVQPRSRIEMINATRKLRGPRMVIRWGSDTTWELRPRG